MQILNLTRAPLAVALALALAACGSNGGGDDAAAEAATQVPASAGANVATYVGYVGSLPADDEREPLGVDAVEPPTSDSEEPLALQ